MKKELQAVLTALMELKEAMRRESLSLDDVETELMDIFQEAGINFNREEEEGIGIFICKGGNHGKHRRENNQIRITGSRT